MSKNSELLNLLIRSLPSISEHHSPSSPLYALLKNVARAEIEKLFADGNDIINIDPFGELVFPYFKMGTIDSLNLFDLDELIIFAYYFMYKNKHRNVLDIGANIGLHSIILGKCGYTVRSFEPDPIHFEKLNLNIKINNIKNVIPINAAVSNIDGEMEFIRVLGNTTGSHIAGSKKDPYGDLERFPVKVLSISEHLKWADLIKLDAEGHEKEILLGTKPSDWEGKEAIIEIASEGNAKILFDFFYGSGIQLYSQKVNWANVKKAEDMPFTHHDGSLLLSSTSGGVWGEL